MRTALWVILISLLISVPASAQYRPEYMLNRLDTLIAKAESQITDIDSLVTVLSQPTPVTIGIPTVLMQNADFTPADRLTCPNALDIDGAVGIMVTCEVDGFVGGFRLTHNFFPSATDSVGVSLPYDTTGVDSALCPYTGTRTFNVYLAVPSGLGIGYYRPQVLMWGTSGAANDLENLTITATAVW